MLAVWKHAQRPRLPRHRRLSGTVRFPDRLCPHTSHQGVVPMCREGRGGAFVRVDVGCGGVRRCEAVSCGVAGRRSLPHTVVRHT